jgi:hypothetical protein
MFSLTDMATSCNEINAVFYTGFNVLTRYARHLIILVPDLGWCCTAPSETLGGIKVLDKIAAAPRDEFDNPLEPIEMKVTVKE